MYSGFARPSSIVAVFQKDPLGYPGALAKTPSIWFNEQKAKKAPRWELLPGKYKIRFRPLIPVGGFEIRRECNGHPGIAGLINHLNSAKSNPEMYEVKIDFDAEAGKKYHLSYRWIGDKDFYLRLNILSEDKSDILASVESHHFNLLGAKVSAANDPGNVDNFYLTFYGCN
ncbi:MAG: hypothetical protein GF353_24935 [Candidatus Lokiarchaeota archaeon]|nr:hypothetical protein [Candidatus Lokiarchaeota archaeon]